MKQCTKCAELIYNNVRDWKTLSNQTAVAYLFMYLFLYYLIQSLVVVNIQLPMEAYTTQLAMVCSQEPV